MQEPAQTTDSLAALQRQAIAFRDQREWRQFHCPKNLAQGLAIETAELMEVFLWKTTDQSRKLTDLEIQRVREEIGDVTLFLLTLCHELDIDPIAATRDKLALNEEKYPVDKAKGNCTKYTDYE